MIKILKKLSAVDITKQNGNRNIMVKLNSVNLAVMQKRKKLQTVKVMMVVVGKKVVTVLPAVRDSLVPVLTV